MAKQELLATIRDRYRASSKREKSLILDEFIAVTGHHRKHGIRLLEQSSDDGEQRPAKKGRRIYDEAVRQALIVVWEAADRICGKRLKAALPHLVESLERHGHLDLDGLASEAGARQRRQLHDAGYHPAVAGPLAFRYVTSPIGPAAPPPGFLEIDLVSTTAAPVP